MKLSVLCNLPARKNWWWEKFGLLLGVRIMLWWLGLCSLPVSCLAWCNPVLECKGSMVRLTVISKRTYTKEHFLDCCCQYSHASAKHYWPSTWDPQTLAGRSGAVFCGVTATLHSVLVCMHKISFMSSMSGDSVSSVLWKSYSLNLVGLQYQIPCSFPVPLLDLQAGKRGMGLRTFTTVGEPLWYYCSQFVDHPPSRYGIWFPVIVPLLSSCCSFFFVYGHKISFWLCVCFSILPLMVF